MTSVVVPVYNGAHVLPSTVPAVLALEGVDGWAWVDDGSTDGSGELLRALTAHEPRAQVLRLGANRGRSEARNRGVEATAGPPGAGREDPCVHAGDVVVFFDADVAPAPGAARALADAARTNGAVAAVGGLVPTGLDPGDPYHVYLARYPRGPQAPAGARVSWRYFVTAAAAVRRDALARAGGFDPAVAYAQDLTLAFRLRATHPCGLAWVPRPESLIADVGSLAVARAKIARFGADELPVLEAMAADALQELGLSRLRRRDPLSRVALPLVRSKALAAAVEHALPRLPKHLVPVAVRYLLGHTLARAARHAAPRAL